MDPFIRIGTFVVTVLGLGAVFLQIRVATTAQARDHLRQKRQATIDAYTNPGAVGFRNELWGVLPNDRDISAVRAFCPAADAVTDDRFRLVIAHLNYYESLSVGVRQDVYDLTVLNDLVGERLVSAWTAYEPFIRKRREILRAPGVWQAFEDLSGRIQALMAESRQREDLRT